MNVDIIEPFNRIFLSGSGKITAIHVDRTTLYLGFANGDLTIMKMNIEQENNRNAPRSVKSSRSFNDVKKLFVDNDQSHMFLLERTFRNVTMNLSSISALQTISIFQDGRKVLLIGNSEVLRVFEWVGSHLNLLASFEEGRNYDTFGFMHYKDQNLILVGLKKKLLVYITLQRSRNVIDFVKSREVLLKERLKVLHCYPQYEKVLLALNNSFFYLDLSDDYSVKDINSNNSNLFNSAQNSSFSYFGLNSPTPCIKILPMDKKTTFIVRGNQVGKVDTPGFKFVLDTKVHLTGLPNNVIYLHPYYLLVVYTKKLEILSMHDGTVIQEFHHQLNSSHIPLFHANDLVVIGSGSHVFQFNILPYQKQLDQFLACKEKEHRKGTTYINRDRRLQGIEQSLAIISHVDEDEEFFKDRSDSQVSNKKMKVLFLRDLYKEKAFIYFEEYSMYRESLVEIASDWILSCKDILSLFPDFLNAEKQLGNNSSRSDFPKGSIKSITDNEALHMKTMDRFTDSESRLSLSPIADSKLKKHHDLQKLQNFATAVDNLIVYLTDQRRLHSSLLASANDAYAINWKDISLNVYDIYTELTPENVDLLLAHFASVIDTSLFLCYYYTKPMLLGPLLRLPNNMCDADTVNHCLLKNLHSHTLELQNFMKELLDFYYGRGLHQDALIMLKELAHESKSHNADILDEFIKSPSLTIAYLQRLGNKNLDLVFKFTRWVLGENENMLIKNSQAIFMNDTYECESYDNLKVYDFLKNSIKRDDLAIIYLEWLLNGSDILDQPSKKSQVVKLSTKLCLLYLKILKSLNVKHEEFLRSLIFTKLHSILSATNDYEPWTILKDIPTSEDRFLKLTIFIYKRLGEHQKSVDILFNQLSDLDGAIKYCAEIYEQQNKRAGQDLLHKLLEDLLMHYEENEALVVKLLELEGDKMDVLRTLTSLPNIFPLHKLHVYLREAVCKEVKLLSTSRVTSQLYKIGSVKIRNEWLRTQSELVEIKSSKQVCRICGKNLGYNVLCLDSDSQVVHYGCFNKNSHLLQPEVSPIDSGHSVCI